MEAAYGEGRATSSKRVQSKRRLDKREQTTLRSASKNRCVQLIAASKAPHARLGQRLAQTMTILAANLPRSWEASPQDRGVKPPARAGVARPCVAGDVRRVQAAMDGDGQAGRVGGQTCQEGAEGERRWHDAWPVPEIGAGQRHREARALRFGRAIFCRTATKSKLTFPRYTCSCPHNLSLPPHNKHHTLPLASVTTH